VGGIAEPPWPPRITAKDRQGSCRSLVPGSTLPAGAECPPVYDRLPGGGTRFRGGPCGTGVRGWALGHMVGLQSPQYVPNPHKRTLSARPSVDLDSTNLMKTARGAWDFPFGELNTMPPRGATFGGSTFSHPFAEDVAAGAVPFRRQPLRSTELVSPACPGVSPCTRVVCVPHLASPRPHSGAFFFFFRLSRREEGAGDGVCCRVPSANPSRSSGAPARRAFAKSPLA